MDSEKEKARRFGMKSSGVEIGAAVAANCPACSAERPVQQGHQWCVVKITRAG